MEIPSPPFERAVAELAKLPGLGRRSALRMALHLHKRGSSATLQLAEALRGLAEDVHVCQQCHSLAQAEICEICANPVRNNGQICVVEDLRDVLALENTQAFRGRYHVLGGLISPMDGMGPDDLQLESLFAQAASAKEIVFALSATMEGDTTAYYLFKKLQPLGLSITAIARGLAVGDALEYADETTLSRSMDLRVPYEQTLKNLG
jgi:recombination protein RecR